MRGLSKRSWLLSLALIAVTWAQGIGQKVEVDKEFVNSAVKAFNEVRVLRELTAEQEKTISLQEQLLSSRESYIEELKKQNLLLQRQIEEYSKLKCSSVSFLFGVIKIKRCK